MVKKCKISKGNGPLHPQRKCCAHQVWCHNIPSSPSGAETFTADNDYIMSHIVSLYTIDKKKHKVSVVRPQTTLLWTTQIKEPNPPCRFYIMFMPQYSLMTTKQ